jgi:molybdopterin molybdotransferase
MFKDDAISEKQRSDPDPASSREVLTLLRTCCRPLTPERVTLEAGLSRVLREPVCAPEDQPAFDCSLVDGYAVRREDRATEYRVVDQIRAGEWKPRELQPGETVRIATGGALPGDGLQVVMQEDVQVEGATMRLVRRDANPRIRRQGEDARRGRVLVEPGTVLQPGTLALLAGAGHTQPLVTRLPRVLHVATGNEIVAPVQTPRPGQVRDSNSTLVRAFLRARGIEPEQLLVPEDEAAAGAAMARHRPPVAEVDLLLVSGGASVGEHDFTRRLLEQLGYTIHVRTTSTRPGKPLIVAQRGGALAFGLPGNPLAHFVCLNLYARAALAAFAGQSPEDTAAIQTGELAADLAAEGNARETFWPARRGWREGVTSLTPLPWRSSGDLTSLATANALIRVVPGAARLESGSRVEFVGTEGSS